MATEDGELSRERRRMRPATVFFISAAALLVLLVSGVGIGLLISERRVREELAKIRAAGEPVTPADLEAFYSLPPASRDTTALWLAAIDIVNGREYKADASGLPLIGEKAPDD